ncbi:MAG TPA: hypothetical protein PKE39_05380 [Ignavibacteria bacterium]|nr:hypothetical protein [Ignavibacteria bacterium]HMQ98435.1 hypothetical protein [Ignavibacteria bacterium]
MKTLKLFTILKTFSSEELKLFEKFITSPYINSGRNVKPVFNVIKKYHPLYPAEKLNEEKIYRLLYKSNKTSEKKGYIKVLLSHLTNLAVEFLKDINDENVFEKRFQEVRFLKMLNYRKLDSLYSAQYKKMSRSLPGEFDSESSPFLLYMLLQKENCNFLLDREYQQKTSDVLLKQTEYLLLYFLSEFFMNRAHYKTNEYVYNAQYEGTILNIVMNNFDFEPVMEFFRNNSPEYYPVIAIYYNSMMAQLDIENDLYFKNFRELLENNSELFNREELGNLFVDLEACCWKRLNNNITELKREFYRKELFDIYKNVLKLGLHKYEHDYMRIHRFRNIVMAALNLKEYDWLENFTKKYHKQLAPENRDNMYNYTLAVLDFNRGRFEEALKLFSKIKYDYFYLKVDVKNWMLLIYYELNLYEQANSLIDTYKHFLAKNKNLSALFKKNNLDFLNVYIKLISFKNGNEAVSLKNITNEVSAHGKFIHKGWLLKKIEEFKKIS